MHWLTCQTSALKIPTHKPYILLMVMINCIDLHIRQVQFTLRWPLRPVGLLFICPINCLYKTWNNSGTLMLTSREGRFFLYNCMYRWLFCKQSGLIMKVYFCVTILIINCLICKRKRPLFLCYFTSVSPLCPHLVHVYICKQTRKERSPLRPCCIRASRRRSARNKRKNLLLETSSFSLQQSRSRPIGTTSDTASLHHFVADVNKWRLPSQRRQWYNFQFALSAWGQTGERWWCSWTLYSGNNDKINC